MRSGISVAPLLPQQMMPSQVMASSQMHMMPGMASAASSAAMGGMGAVGGMGLGLPPSAVGYPDVMPQGMPGHHHHRRMMELEMSARTPSQSHHHMGRVAPSPSVSSGSHRQLNPAAVDPLAVYLSRQEQQLQAQLAQVGTGPSFLPASRRVCCSVELF